MAAKTFLKTTLAILLFVIVACTTVAVGGQIIYVDDDATSANNGSSWEDAYNYLQDALAACCSSDEIRVAQGIYKPDQGAGITLGDRAATFQLINAVTLKGGYAGLGGPDPNARDIELYETILSGDLGGNDVESITVDDLLDEFSRSENCHHVITSSGTNETAVLDGFTIAAGNSNSYYYKQWRKRYSGCGAGVYNSDGSPTLINCIFTCNSAGLLGGGMYNESGSPKLIGCTFSNNATFGDTLAIGGGAGMYNGSGSSPTLVDCTFSGNSVTDDDGGGLLNYRSNPYLTECTFSGNSVSRTGGGMYNYESNPTLTRCTFSDNSAGAWGGGVYNGRDSNTAITNCTFKGNTAYYGGGGVSNWLGNSPTLTNCIFMGNSAQLYFGGGMLNARNSKPILTNCTFCRNYGPDAGGMYNDQSSPVLTNCTFTANSAESRAGGILNTLYSSPTLTNCILWGNSDGGSIIELAQIHDLRSMPVVNYSCIEGLSGDLGGTGNIGNDPLLVDADGTDDVFGTDDDNLRLLGGSPCIDAGNNSAVPPSVITDLDGKPRIINGIVDMGAYEGPNQGVVLSPKSITIPEGDTAAFTVALAMDPFTTVHVTVAVGTGDPDIIVESGGTLTFDSSNYLQPQRVILAAAEDSDYFNGTAIVEVSAFGFPTVRVIVNEWDNDAPTILYVDDSATGAECGTSWADAFTDLQDALSMAEMVPPVEEIRVAQGVYTPADPCGDREATFQLINGVAIKGGYAGFGEPSPDSRDIEIYETVLSGDLSGDDGREWLEEFMACLLRYELRLEYACDAFDLDGNNNVDTHDLIAFLATNNYVENSRHVLTANGTNETAILDGFTITRGIAYLAGAWDWPDSRAAGGGMYNNYGSPTISNCTFTQNWAHGGGGVYNCFGRPLLINCTFSENLGGGGGGMRNDEARPILTNCTFRGNSAEIGGGMESYYCELTLNNCAFSRNRACSGGGMESNNHSSSALNSCLFNGNWAQRGAGMCDIADSCVTLANCTFTGNLAVSAGGATSENLGGGIYVDGCNLVVANCIFWGNVAARGPQIALCWDPRGSHSTTVRLDYSNVQAGLGRIHKAHIGCQVIWGQGNIDDEPLFVEPGYWDANGTPQDANDDVWVDGDYHLLEDSPCIDAGDPNYIAEPNETDLDDRPRIIFGRIDMGAYETPILAEVRIIPQTINLASKGNWITCYIRLPDEYDVADIEPNSVFLEDEIKPGQFSVDQQQQVAIARFNREDVLAILEVGDINLKIIGRLTDGSVFEATDTIKVIDKAGPK